MDEINILSGFAVINNTLGKQITFTYSRVNAEGTMLESNINKSFVILDDETKTIIDQLEKKIETKMNESSTK